MRDLSEYFTCFWYSNELHLHFALYISIVTIRVLEIYKKKHKGAKKGEHRRMSSVFQSTIPLLPDIGTKGYDLLKKKSDALTVRFRALLKDIYKVNGSCFRLSR